MNEIGRKSMQNLPTNKETKVRSGKRIAIAFLALSAILIAATYPNSASQPAEKQFVLVLDAGHGGKDPGNLGTGRHKTTEKDVALDVILELGKSIEQNYPDVKVVYTRKGDSFPTLKDRVDIANKNQADLFISVHCNANANKEAYGSETYVMGLHKSEESLQTAMRENASIYLEENHASDYDGFDPKNPDTYIALSLRENVFLDRSLGLAKDIQDHFRVKVGRKDRGVKQAGYYVISFTNMPSILVELGFLTNANEEDFLQSKEGKSQLASSIFKAFKAYRSKDGLVTKPTENAVSATEPKKTETKPSSESSASKTATKTDVPNEVIKSGVKFQVQILTSPKAIKKNSPEFKGLTNIDEYLSSGSYKYATGSTSSFKEAKALQSKLREMGFKDAFVIAWENNKRIDLNQAISLANGNK
jgi:N-acetylmuramoyl-L-alanine amidase